MAQHDSVTVDHGGLTITTNTASEADLRAEMTRDAPAPAAPEPSAPPAGEPTDAASPARDAQGRFLKKDAAPESPAPGADADAPPDPAAAPQRRRDDTLPRHNPIARMNQALAQKAEADRRAAALEAELAQYRQVGGPKPPQVPRGQNGQFEPYRDYTASQPAVPATEPQFEQFGDQPDPYTAYLQAWTRWDHARQVEERFQRYEQAQAAKVRDDQFATHLSEGRKAYPDFDQRLTEADTLGLQVSAVMREAITASPRAADLVYFLATHPEECTQLALESEQESTAAAPWVRRVLEGYLAPRAVSSNGSGAAARASASTAKPPIQPVGSSPVVSDEPPGESASAAEHARYWNRRLKVPGTR